MITLSDPCQSFFYFFALFNRFSGGIFGYGYLILFNYLVIQFFTASWKPAYVFVKKVVVYKLGGCGFEFSCSYLNFRDCAFLEKGVSWYFGNYRADFYVTIFNPYQHVLVTLSGKWKSWSLIEACFHFM